MPTVNLIDDYVRRRLDAWGQEFALHRDGEILGHKSKDMLQVLIEHKGEMPPRPTGFRPLTLPPAEMQIEDIVHGIAIEAPELAWVLRAYYCGSGRRRVERLALARLFLGRRITARAYFDYHAQGFDLVRDALQRMRNAA